MREEPAEFTHVFDGEKASLPVFFSPLIPAMVTAELKKDWCH
jgi:hypothetical protein